MTTTAETNRTQSQTTQTTLVSTDWADQHRNDVGVVLIEVDVDTGAYDEGHIPGAIGWNWKTDLQRKPVRDIPTQQEWESLLSRSGIQSDTTVLLYGDNNNWFAAFAYWLFRLYGHHDVRLVDGGRRKWMDEGREVATDVATVQSSEYKASAADPSIRAYRDDVKDLVDGGLGGIVDVRSPGEYSGELLAPQNLPQEGAQRGGHVPGARSIPWGTAVAENGTFKSIDELKTIYGGEEITGDGPVIAYCRIGERSAHTWFVLHELLGYPDVRNYDGSWTEWGSLIGAPIETGS